MVEFKPFAGYRPALKDNEKIEDRVSPPYDVIGEAYLKELQSHRNNVTRFTLMPKNGRYANSRKELDAAIADGSLLQDPESFCIAVTKTPVPGVESIILSRSNAARMASGVKRESSWS